jgi:beta-lactamase class A
VIRDMLALDAIAPFEDLAPLWDWTDASLETQLRRALAELGLDDDARRGRLAVALVDLTDPDVPRVAAVNPDHMMYAASLPKIAVLLAAFEKIAQGRMPYDDEARRLMERMIRQSDNAATTELMHRVGKEYIARVLLSPRYRLYDPRHDGGLWVGKDYAQAGLWRRDPLHNLSHGATPMQVARFYYLLQTENLVTPQWSREMKRVMSGREHLNHKFVRGLTRITSRIQLARKSGSWGTFHSDSALVTRSGHTYIAVALCDDPNGSNWMSELIVAMDRIIIPVRGGKS